jgi:hypothetical protein
LFGVDRNADASDAKSENGSTRNEMMAVVTSPFVLLPAVVGLFALTQAVGDAALKVDDQGSSQAISDVTGSLPADVALPAPGAGPEEMQTDAPAIGETFSCLQLQIIDEVELIADMPAGTDCN